MMQNPSVGERIPLIIGFYFVCITEKQELNSHYLPTIMIIIITTIAVILYRGKSLW